MRLLFIDETQCTVKNQKYFAVAGLLLHSSSYKKIKENFDKSIDSIGWDPEKEFKGCAIFSESTGDESVSVDDRIKLTSLALEGLNSNKRSRCKFWICHNQKGKTEGNYINLLSKIVSILPKPETGPGKNLILIVVDNENSFSKDKIIKAIKQNIKKGYVIIEDPYFLESKTSYCGLVLVDVLAYLKTWTILNKSESSQLELFFKGMSKPSKIKLQTAKNLLKEIKNITVTST